MQDVHRVELDIDVARVVLTNAKFRCTKCKRWKGARHFGLRRMKWNVVRQIPQCTTCRNG